MSAAQFYIRPGRGRVFISTPDKAAEIAVYKLNEQNFSEKYGKLVMYGVANGHPLAFEMKRDLEKIDMITAAIRWYANEINSPEMELYLSDPRSAIIN